MRICIPTTTDTGVTAVVSEHFGSAPYFTIYDCDSRACETIDNSDLAHAHGACNPIAALTDARVDFRQLVRELAHEYQTRIEMRQIGVRDALKLLDEIIQSFLRDCRPHVAHQ